MTLDCVRWLSNRGWPFDQSWLSNIVLPIYIDTENEDNLSGTDKLAKTLTAVVKVTTKCD